MTRPRRHSLLALLALPAVLAIARLASAVPQASSTPPQPDGQMQAVLDQLAVLGPKPIETLSPGDARHQPSMSDAVVQLLQSKGIAAPEKLPKVGSVDTVAITGPDGKPLNLRVYSPEGAGPFPVVVYLHGGGWVLATLDTYDSSCRAISSLTK